MSILFVKKGSSVSELLFGTPTDNVRDLSLAYIYGVMAAGCCFYSAAALLATQSAVLATAILRLSVTRWYPIQTNEDRIMRSSL